MKLEVGSVDLPGTICMTASRPGGGVVAEFRVDYAEGGSRWWALLPSECVPRFWKLVVPHDVLAASGTDSLAGHRVRVTGTMHQDESNQIDVTRIHLNGEEASA